MKDSVNQFTKSLSISFKTFILFLNLKNNKHFELGATKFNMLAACCRLVSRKIYTNYFWIDISRSIYSSKKDQAKASSTSDASKKFTIPTKAYKLHKLEEGPAKSSEITTEQARAWFTEMAIIRRLENECGALYKAKIARGFCHLYSGQEAIAVGIASNLSEDDAVITAYRCHAWAYLCGATLHEIMAELAGKVTGNVRGKGGSMHLYTSNFYGGNGIVGAQVPLGAGVALSMKYQNMNNVIFILYGDGAANQGQIFETFNIAKLWNLPCIFVCENNHYAMGTSNERSSASKNYYTRGDYISGIFVDGMQILTVREASKYAMNHVKSGKGPIILEMNTYRYSGHSMSDPGISYRSPTEVAEVRKTRDPINEFKKYITRFGIMTEDEMKQIEDDAKKQITADSNKAKSDPEPKIEELTSDVSKNYLEPDIRGILPWTRLKHNPIGIRNASRKKV